MPKTLQRVEFLDTVIDVTSDVADVSAALQRLLPASARDPGHDPDAVFHVGLSAAARPELRLPDGTREEADTWGAVFAILFAEINNRVLEACEDFAAHCGVVSCHGLAVGFPGESGFGKSTLVAACVAAGLDYVSDEALVMQYTDATIRPYLKPMALSPGSRALVGVRQLPFPYAGDSGPEALVMPADLGGVPAEPPLRLAHVVRFRRSDSSQTQLRPATKSQVQAALLENSFNHYRRPSDAFALTHRLASEARSWELTYSDATSAAHLVAEMCAAGSAPGSSLPGS